MNMLRTPINKVGFNRSVTQNYLIIIVLQNRWVNRGGIGNRKIMERS